MYEMLINIIIIHTSILFFNIYIFIIINKKLICWLQLKQLNLYKFVKYNIDYQSFKNVVILNIKNKSYRTNYILQCAENIMYFS